MMFRRTGRRRSRPARRWRIGGTAGRSRSGRAPPGSRAAAPRARRCCPAALDPAEHAVEVRAHLLDLVVERSALRRLAAEQREETAAFATQLLRLLSEPVELRLLLVGGVLIAPDLIRRRRIACCRGRAWRAGLRAGCRPDAAGRRRGRRIWLLCGRRRGAQHDDGQPAAQCAQKFRDPVPVMKWARPAAQLRMKLRNGDQSVKRLGRSNRARMSSRTRLLRAGHVVRKAGFAAAAACAASLCRFQTMPLMMRPAPANTNTSSGSA